MAYVESIAIPILGRPGALNFRLTWRLVYLPLVMSLLVMIQGPSQADDYEAVLEAWMTGDTAEAVNLLEPLAEDGDPRAQLDLGKVLQSTSDNLQAADWFRQAADQGSSEARVRLADLYRTGRGVERNAEQAVALYKTAAEDGLAEAEYKFGICHETGYGVSQDYAIAAEWYSRAASQGQASAQYRLADLYFFGFGVSQNLEQALKWYRAAARQGEQHAIFRLRLLGEAIPPLTVATEVTPLISKPGSQRRLSPTGTPSHGTRVQLAAFRDQSGAISGWKKIRAAYPDLLNNFEPEFVVVDFGPAKGTYVRLLVGPFNDRGGANSLCARIKARSGDCLVVVRSEPL